MRFYFICLPPGPPENTPYHHEMLAIAEGLSELGFEIAANINYWQLSPDAAKYAIPEATTHDIDAYDVIIFSSDVYEFHAEYLLPTDLFKSSRRYKIVFVDQADGLITPAFRPEMRSADLVLKCHYNKYFDYPSNFVPWQFGLTNRIIQSCSPVGFEEREQVILSGFRVSHPIRTAVDDVLTRYAYNIYPKSAGTDGFECSLSSDLDTLFWAQTGRRHYPSFYKRLGVSLLCNASGGGGNKILKSPLLSEKSILLRAVRRLERHLEFLPLRSVHQFDSWRFWESLASGCCTLHIDFDKYGCTLPENPVNGIHYLGIDLGNPEESMSILQDRRRLPEISNRGRAWAIDFYSPQAVAKRLVKMLA